MQIDRQDVESWKNILNQTLFFVDDLFHRKKDIRLPDYLEKEADFHSGYIHFGSEGMVEPFAKIKRVLTNQHIKDILSTCIYGHSVVFEFDLYKDNMCYLDILNALWGTLVSHVSFADNNPSHEIGDIRVQLNNNTGLSFEEIVGLDIGENVFDHFKSKLDFACNNVEHFYGSNKWQSLVEAREVVFPRLIPCCNLWLVDKPSLSVRDTFYNFNYEDYFKMSPFYIKNVFKMIGADLTSKSLDAIMQQKQNRQGQTIAEYIERYRNCKELLQNFMDLDGEKLEIWQRKTFYYEQAYLGGIEWES